MKNYLPLRIIQFFCPFFTCLFFSSFLLLNGNLKANELLIKIKPNYSLDANHYLQIHNTLSVKSVSSFHILKNWQVIELPEPVDILQAKSFYQKQDFVEIAEPNSTLTIFNHDIQDILFPEQWALSNSGQWGGKVGNDVSALQAWELLSGDSAQEPIIVAVIDTGVEYTHPDLSKNMWVNTKEIPGNGIDDDQNGYVDDIYGYNFYSLNGDPVDDYGHGTHCAGIIAATHNHLGIRGIAPLAKIMAVKFLGPYGDGDVKNAILAIEYAIINGAKILSNSWGGPPESNALNDMIIKAKEAGILFVAAAGNDHSNNDVDPTFPSSYDVDNIISVGASNPKDEAASFSNWGTQKVHLFAPGQYILSPFPEGQYKTASGTSMATPLVAGAAALLWSQNPDWDYQQIKERLISTVDHISDLEDKSLSGGRLNVYHVLTGESNPHVGPDPRWEEFSSNVNSPHPYPSLYKGQWEVSHPGAKFIKVHFSRLETQKRMDYVGLLDSQGVMNETITGHQGQLWSRVVPGDKLTLTLRSDSEVNEFGFEIDRYAVIMN